MKYKDLFIDFDDTLYDTHGNAVIALHETFEAFRLDRWFPDPQVFYDAYWAANIDLWTRYSKGEITRDYLIVERFRRPLNVYPKTTHQLSPPWEGPGEAFCLEMSDRFLDFCATKPGVVEGAHELMDYLKGKGYRMHMTSNGFHEVQYKKLAACGLKDYFDTIILSEDAGGNKPSPLYFDYAFKVSGASRETTLMIGDNLQTDILGALNAGIDALLFNRWAVDVSVSPQAPTFVVDSLRDIIHILQG
jgi:putative hydrolase of the HAD superfamily